MLQKAEQIPAASGRSSCWPIAISPIPCDSSGLMNLDHPDPAGITLSQRGVSVGTDARRSRQLNLVAPTGELDLPLEFRGEIQWNIPVIVIAGIFHFTSHSPNHSLRILRHRCMTTG